MNEQQLWLKLHSEHKQCKGLEQYVILPMIYTKHVNGYNPAARFNNISWF